MIRERAPKTFDLKLPFGMHFKCVEVQKDRGIEIYTFDYVVNGNKISLDKPIVGSSKCAPDDTWNYITGYKVALNRLVAKICMSILKVVPIPEEEVFLCSSS